MHPLSSNMNDVFSFLFAFGCVGQMFLIRKTFQAFLYCSALLLVSMGNHCADGAAIIRKTKSDATKSPGSIKRTKNEGGDGGVVPVRSCPSSCTLSGMIASCTAPGGFAAGGFVVFTENIDDTLRIEEVVPGTYVCALNDEPSTPLDASLLDSCLAANQFTGEPSMTAPLISRCFT